LSSRGQILRSTSIIGGAAAINIAIGLVRTKTAALLLGPLGIGEIGLFLNLVQFIATIGALGLGTSAVRQIAEAIGREDLQDVAAARRALLWISIASAVVVAIAFTIFVEPIGHTMSLSAEQIAAAPWLSVAAGATILSGVPVALLIGYRRIAHQALVQIGGAVLGTVIGLICLFVWGRDGIIGYTISAPLTQLAFGLLFAFRLPRIEEAFDPLRIRRQAVAMVSLGIPFTAGALSMTGGMLALRALISDRLGLSALGQFTAAWTLCVTYVSFVLQATGADYFPRLSSAISDVERTHRTITEQLEVTLLMSLPLIVAVQAMGPWLLQLLYSSAFVEAVTVVRWQVLGDLFKIAATPIAYVMLASRRGKTYWLGETLAIALLVILTEVMIDRVGLASTGIAYVGMYIGYFAFALLVAWRLTGFILARSSVVTLIGATAIVLVTTVCSMIAPCLGLVVGGVLSIASGLLTIRSLDLHNAALRRWPALSQFDPRSLKF
jgi:PST family polysaccharide transporter